MVSLFFCIITVYAHPQDLHSFPTRRSSDLNADDTVDRLGGGTGVEAAGLAVARHLTADALHDRLGRKRHFPKRVFGRSEEHTSELQSLRHLVCRLLLEKKKKIENSNSLKS